MSEYLGCIFPTGIDVNQLSGRLAGKCVICY